MCTVGPARVVPRTFHIWLCAQSGQLVGYQKLSQNSHTEKVQLKFMAPKEGTVQYEIHCLCSAYIGADKKVRGRAHAARVRACTYLPLSHPTPFARRC